MTKKITRDIRYIKDKPTLLVQGRLFRTTSKTGILTTLQICPVNIIITYPPHVSRQDGQVRALSQVMAQLSVLCHPGCCCCCCWRWNVEHRHPQGSCLFHHLLRDMSTIHIYYDFQHCPSFCAKFKYFYVIVGLLLAKRCFLHPHLGDNREKYLSGLRRKDKSETTGCIRRDDQNWSTNCCSEWNI